MLTQKMLVDIFQLFCGIRTYSQHNDALKSYIVTIKEMQVIVNDFGNELQKDIFTYCFNLLKTAIEHQNHVFIFDFADAIHNLPEIFYPDTHWGNTPRSSLKTFWKLFIQPLRNRHGKHLFNDFKHVFINSQYSSFYRKQTGIIQQIHVMINNLADRFRGCSH